MQSLSSTLMDEVRDELVGNILPFWSTVALDPVRGGVHGQVSNELVVDDTVDRTAVVCARTVWAFSAAARELGDPRWLEPAAAVRDALVEHFVDPVYGGVFWAVRADGTVAEGRKQMYAQAFALYALAEYGRASGDATAVQQAMELFGQIERNGADPVGGGYLEACGRDWTPIADVRLSPRDLNAPKSMNTMLHVMEAYTTLAQVTGSALVRERLASLVATILDRIVDLDRGCFRLFLDLDWTSLSETVSYGHDIEGAWLLVAAARATGDAALLGRAERAAVVLATAVRDNGRDDDRAVLYERIPGRDGTPEVVDRDSHWWVQAEGAVGFLEAARITGDQSFADAASACWDVIAAHHVDRVHGDWFKRLDGRSPDPTSPKVGPWECPYHHVRACLELVRRLSEEPEEPR